MAGVSGRSGHLLPPLRNALLRRRAPGPRPALAQGAIRNRGARVHTDCFDPCGCTADDVRAGPSDEDRSPLSAESRAEEGLRRRLRAWQHAATAAAVGDSSAVRRRADISNAELESARP